MKFINRLGYYLGGFAIGLIFLAFFLSGKRTSCDYGPEARVLKNISTKKQIISIEAQQRIQEYQLDSTYLSTVLKQGNVNFKKSNIGENDCNIYAIEDETDTFITTLFVENCDSIATITSIEMKK